ncbi:MAG: ZIP family metal transporter [Planctomycetes bacterium]|nr:ZIP family metal transporter [Planctomycetota bacterium]
MDMPWLWTACGVIAVASVFGGIVPTLVRLTHQRMQIALSFVSGVMLGVALFHMLPHAIMENAQGREADHHTINPVMISAALGFLAMFFLERFASFHQHDVVEEGGGSESKCDHGHDHDGHHHGVTPLTWSGAALGLSLHSVLEGVALASSVAVAATLHPGVGLAGLGTFLVILLHKPFDAMTLTTLLRASKMGAGKTHLVNFLFALIVPVGAGLFLLKTGGGDHAFTACALAFSAGSFLCIAGSDLLPELHFHSHDRVRLSLALVLGLAIAWGIGAFEAMSHDEAPDHHGTPAAPHSALTNPSDTYARIAP